MKNGEATVQLGRDILAARASVNESIALHGRNHPATRTQRVRLTLLQKSAQARFR
ncbi:hypothetical protein QDW18_gp53 [Microbacterium phage Katzastrophic]|uniref:hypothetical protein n=1 Tax=Microbacterium phage Katzastrophic TaxID=2912654 RepID=UPI002431738C|nr:hypothetical protein QDW18_gp53 [Microbacterium phage Katzastrophic]UKH48490.1 hypothetical protein SEA_KATZASTROPHIC_53 [Microbacterium phage Katzastrophic]